MANVKPGETLISFESGHYKTVRGKWVGDSIWTHILKPDGGAVHINKDKVEYYETGPRADMNPKPDPDLGLKQP